MPTFTAPPSQEQQPPTPAVPPPGSQSASPQGRTFTEDEVNRIVEERLARDRATRAAGPSATAPATQQRADQLLTSPTPTGPDTPVFTGMLTEPLEQALAPMMQAINSLQQRFEQNDQQRAQTAAQQAQQAFRSVLHERAGHVLQDPRDADNNVDPAALLDANGQPDVAKIDAALQQLVTDRPHYRKGPRVGIPTAQGAGFGEPGAMSPEDKAKHLRATYGA